MTDKETAEGKREKCQFCANCDLNGHLTIRTEVKTMALKNLFDMVKADRYTQDGREELIKAQEAETEDKLYQIGEISQKTGLQKTANGWVKPKNGKQAGAKKEGSHPAAGATNGDKWQKNTDYLGRERISMETPQGGKVSIYESSNPKQKNARFRVDTGSHYNEFNTLEEAKAFAEKQYGRESKSESKPGRDRPVLKKEDHVKLAKEVLSNTSATDPGWTAEEIAKEWKLGKADAEEVKKAMQALKIHEGVTKTLNKQEAAAPRVLTGDTRIRVRK